MFSHGSVVRSLATQYIYMIYNELEIKLFQPKGKQPPSVTNKINFTKKKVPWVSPSCKTIYLYWCWKCTGQMVKSTGQKTGCIFTSTSFILIIQPSGHQWRAFPSEREREREGEGVGERDSIQGRGTEEETEEMERGGGKKRQWGSAGVGERERERERER